MTILIWLILSSPAIPLALLWFHWLNSGRARLAVAAMTCSYIWLLVALVTPLESRLLGPPYSSLRVTIPYANIAVVTAAMIFLAFRGKRETAVLAGVSTILCWLYVRVISFAV